MSVAVGRPGNANLPVGAGGLACGLRPAKFHENPSSGQAVPPAPLWVSGAFSTRAPAPLLEWRRPLAVSTYAVTPFTNRDRLTDARIGIVDVALRYSELRAPTRVDGVHRFPVYWDSLRNLVRRVYEVRCAVVERQLHRTVARERNLGIAG